MIHPNVNSHVNKETHLHNGHVTSAELELYHYLQHKKTKNPWVLSNLWSSILLHYFMWVMTKHSFASVFNSQLNCEMHFNLKHFIAEITQIPLPTQLYTLIKLYKHLISNSCGVFVCQKEPKLSSDWISCISQRSHRCSQTQQKVHMWPGKDIQAQREDTQMGGKSLKQVLSATCV